MHFTYYFCNGHPLLAFREYRYRYPDRGQPCWRIFVTTRHDLRETGILMPHSRHGRARRNARDVEYLFDIVHDNPSTITRHVSSATRRLSRSSAWNTLRGDQLYHFHVQVIQRLQSGYTFPSIVFSVGVTQDCGHPSICVSWPDEALCTLTWYTQSTYLACMGDSSSYLSLFVPEPIWCQRLGRVADDKVIVPFVIQDRHGEA